VLAAVFGGCGINYTVATFQGNIANTCGGFGMRYPNDYSVGYSVAVALNGSTIISCWADASAIWDTLYEYSNGCGSTTLAMAYGLDRRLFSVNNVTGELMYYDPTTKSTYDSGPYNPGR